MINARSIELIRVAVRILRTWSQLAADDRQRLQEEARRVRTALGDVRRSTKKSTDGWRRQRQERQWEKARAVALNPPPEDAVALKAVAVIAFAGEIAVRELALVVGASDENDQTLVKALRIAEADGRIRWKGNRVSIVTEERILESNRSIGHTGHVDAVADEIRSLVVREGLAPVDDIARTVGRSHGDAIFRVALIRALGDGSIAWLGPQMYGLPPDRLREHVRVVDEEDGSEPNLRDALAELTSAVSSFRSPMARLVRQHATPSVAPGTVQFPKSPHDDLPG